MALSAGGGAGGGRRRRGRGRTRRQTLSEINVTPLVDVMLVLLIIFMISAPLLTVGVQVDLPKTEASSIQDEQKPVSVSIRKDGALFVQEARVDAYDLVASVKTAAHDDMTQRVFVRADGGASYEAVARVMAKLSTSGFTKIALITDTGAPDKPAR